MGEIDKQLESYQPSNNKSSKQEIKCSKIIVYFDSPIYWSNSKQIADAIFMIKGVTHLKGVRARKRRTK